MVFDAQGQIHSGSQFFSVDQDQQGHNEDVGRDMMRNTY